MWHDRAFVCDNDTSCDYRSKAFGGPGPVPVSSGASKTRIGLCTSIFSGLNIYPAARPRVASNSKLPKYAETSTTSVVEQSLELMIMRAFFGLN